VRRPAAVLAILLSGWLGAVGAAHSVEPAVSAPPVRTSVPVLLVPGWLDTARELAALRIRLSAAGWSHVETLSFADPTGGNRRHAAEIDSVVAEMIARTGAPEVDIVAHSMGGLATRWYLKTRPEAPVRKVVFMASPHRGTLSAVLAWGDGSDEMLPTSDFLESLNTGPALPLGVSALTIRTPVDTHIFPAESATLPGVPDRSVCCPTHAGMLHDEEVFRLVSEFLEDSALPADPTASAR
jgi:triacylglycerol lipase